jgi:tRNA U34 5-carboxymethylaminomethyl modifying enzyme MnmG/GidA
VDYIDGADLIANEAIEQIILNGLRSYGLEYSVMDGFLIFQNLNSKLLEELQQNQINNSSGYNSVYDKLHI